MRCAPDSADGILLRDAVAADLDALTALARSTYVDAFGESFASGDLAAHLATRLSREAIRRMLAADRFIVAEVSADLVGFLQIGSALAEDLEGLVPVPGETLALRRLYVAAHAQHRGIGTRLLRRALADEAVATASRVVLDVWEHNPGARRLYERFGFRVVGSRPFAVASGAPTSADLVMELVPRESIAETR